jgi:hypothetical protein
VKIKIIVIFTLLFASAYAQPTLDTIQQCLRKKPKPFAKLDTRNSFVENSRAKIFGIKLGLAFTERLQFGIGYNQLYPGAKNSFIEPIYYYNENGAKLLTYAKLQLFYISVHAEYAFYQTKHWRLSMPIQVGVGKSNYKFYINNQKYTTNNKFNFIYEPAVSIEYKFVKWIGVGADLGYRFALTSEKKFNQQFNSPIYAFKLLIYYGEIYRTIFKKNKD